MITTSIALVVVFEPVPEIVLMMAEAGLISWYQSCHQQGLVVALLIDKDSRTLEPRRRDTVVPGVAPERNYI
jgi:hypothetical protein